MMRRSSFTAALCLGLVARVTSSSTPTARLGQSQISTSTGQVIVFGGFTGGQAPINQEGTADAKDAWEVYNGLHNDAWMYDRGK